MLLSRFTLIVITHPKICNVKVIGISDTPFRKVVREPKPPTDLYVIPCPYRGEVMLTCTEQFVNICRNLSAPSGRFFIQSAAKESFLSRKNKAPVPAGLAVGRGLRSPWLIISKIRKPQNRQSCKKVCRRALSLPEVSPLRCTELISVCALITCHHSL